MNIRKIMITLFMCILASLLLTVARADGFHLPESLRYIDEEAFAGTAVEEITLPESVIHVGENAFAFTEKLESIQIPNNSIMLSDNGILRIGGITRNGQRIPGHSNHIGIIPGNVPHTASSEEITTKKKTQFRRITADEIIPPGETANQKRIRTYEESKRNISPIHPELPPDDWIFP